MARLKSIIVEDEPKAADVLKRYIQEIELLELIGVYRNPVAALEFLESNSVDLLFLDINMPKISGIDLLNASKKTPMVIFTTAYSEFAVESYDFGAIDYLLKPIEFPRFLKAISKIHKHINQSVGPVESARNEDKIMYIKSGPQIHKIAESDILFLEKDGNYIVFHVEGKKILSRQNMKDIFDLLDPNHFLRIHKSYVVNIEKISVFENDQLFIGEHSLPIGRTYKDDVMDTLK